MLTRSEVDHYRACRKFSPPQGVIGGKLMICCRRCRMRAHRRLRREECNLVWIDIGYVCAGSTHVGLEGLQQTLDLLWSGIWWNHVLTFRYLQEDGHLLL